MQKNMVLAFFVMMGVYLGIISNVVFVNASEISLEDEFASAKVLELNEVFAATLETEDYYKFTTSDTVDYLIQPVLLKDISFQVDLYNEDGIHIGRGIENLSGRYWLDYIRTLEPNTTYYLKLSYYHSFSVGTSTNYTISVTETEYQLPSEYQSAKSIKLNTKFSDSISNETKYYKFTTTGNDSYYRVLPDYGTSVELYDENSNKIHAIHTHFDDRGIKLEKNTTYYLMISYYSSKKFTVEVNETKDDISDYSNQSKKISLNKVYDQCLEALVDVDYFKFTTKSSTKYSIRLSLGNNRNGQIHLYDEAGKEIGHAVRKGEGGAAYLDVKLKPKSTYYIKTSYYGHFQDMPLNYSISVVENNGGVNIVKSKEYIAKGKTKKLKTTNKIEKSSIDHIMWYSSNYEIATVTKYGTVKGIKPGKAKITYYVDLTDSSFITDSCWVVVK